MVLYYLLYILDLLYTYHFLDKRISLFELVLFILLFNLYTVSYTHLDVYKRQASARFPQPLLPASAQLCSSLVGHAVGLAMGEAQPDEASRWHGTCLLYTSLAVLPSETVWDCRVTLQRYSFFLPQNHPFKRLISRHTASYCALRSLNSAFASLRFFPVLWIKRSLISMRSRKMRTRSCSNVSRSMTATALLVSLYA